jgi:hypothetical protein
VSVPGEAKHETNGAKGTGKLKVLALLIEYSGSKPILKYGAKASKWKVDDKVLNGITMIVDMNNLATPLHAVQDNRRAEA